MEFNKDTLPAAIGSVLEQNNYSVDYSVKFSGAETDIVATPIGNPFSSKLYVEATIEYVDNTKYGKDVTKFISLRESDPSGVFIIVSEKGFTADVRERAKSARIRTYTYQQFFKEFERFQPYIDHILSNRDLEARSLEYEEANFADDHGNEVATQWFMDWSTKKVVDNHWIILLGEYGTGKTCITEVLQYRITEKYLADPSGVIPIRVSLRDFSRQFDARTLIHHFLDHNRLGHIPIDFVFTLIRAHRIVLLLDGYDEMAQFMNPRERRACLKTLADLSAEGARGVLTSRPNYFTVDEELRVFEALYSSFDNRTFHLGLKDKALLEEEASIDRLVQEHILNRFERALKDLTPEQTESLVARKLIDDPVGRDIVLTILKKTFRDETLDSVRRNLSGKPVIITYLLEIVDEIKEDEEKIDASELSEWRIYALIIDKLMLRDYRRSPSVNPLARRDFLQSLAMRLSERGEGVAKQDLFVDLVSRHFKGDLRLLSSEDRRRRVDELFDDMRSSATLTRTVGGDGWGFSHNSLREFFVASAMIGGLLQGRPLSTSVPISPVMSGFVTSMHREKLQEVVEKFGELWGDRSAHSNIGSYLSLIWPSLRLSEGSGFDRLSGSSGKALMLDGVRIEGIKFATEPGLSGKSIVGNGSEFSDTSFVGVDLHGSEFRDSILDSVSFVDCKLSGATFDGAFLFECSFINCDFTGATFRGLDESANIFVGLKEGMLTRLEGKELLGFLSFNGSSTDNVSDFDRLSFHPKISIIEKILDRLSGQRNCQIRGLTQRGEAQKDPRFARGFVDILHQKGWTTLRQNMIGLTSSGREMVSQFFEARVMPEEFKNFLERN